MVNIKLLLLLSSVHSMETKGINNSYFFQEDVQVTGMNTEVLG
jgi:hypothetical protein